ncbi:MAG: type II toxin-antitoxin system VapC family toxin [Betaproteobacteria bacterium]|jgi:predicted nucleic acid-binding protein
MPPVIPVGIAYVDTSALLKWYLPEAGDTQLADWIESVEEAAISRLTIVEAHCALNRRLREGSLTPRASQEAYRLLQEDVAAGRLTLFTVRDADLLAADTLLHRLTKHPLRTLDALHLAICTERNVRSFASADRRLIAAADALDLQTHLF